MAYTSTRTANIFTAGESAPSPENAISALVPNQLGNLALDGFSVDNRNPRSKVELDSTVEPPVLVLNEAVTNILSGYFDTENGGFVPFASTYQFVDKHTVSGEYSGPGSQLSLK
jgi:hypothetical protein